jgi:hypothetical protein
MHDMLENGRINRTPASGMIDQTERAMFRTTPRSRRQKTKKPRGKPRGFCLKIEKEDIRSLQTWQRPTLPSLET